MSSIYTVAYASSSTNLMEESDLQHLLEECRVKNTQNNVTGILLYHDGNILQFLEGAQKHIESLLVKIEQDTRHKGIIRLLTRKFPSRNFQNWSMGYVRCTERKLDDPVPGFDLILERDDISVLETDDIAPPIKDLLRSFHRIVYTANMKIVHAPHFTYSLVQ